MVFALLLMRNDAEFAGHAYVGVYIATSLAWLWLVEGMRPDRADAVGAVVCLAGAAIILQGRRLGI